MKIATTAILLLAIAVTEARAADEPQWLIEARAREGQLIELQPVASEDRWFSSKAPAKVLEKIVKESGSYTVALDIGSGDEPMYCEVFEDAVDLANGLRNTSNASFDAIAKHQGKIEQKELEATDGGWDGSAQYLAARWVYVVNVKKEKRLGGLKQVMFNKDEAFVYCAHNELGYQQTFAQVAREFVKHLSHDGMDAPSGYEEVVVARLANRIVGVGSMRVDKDADGDRRTLESMSMLLPVGGGALSAQDSVKVQFSDPKDEMINAAATTVSNGEMDLNVELKSGEKGGWVVSGEYKGKKITETIPAGPSPMTSIARMALARDLAKQGKAVDPPRDYLVWVSSSPTKFMPGQLSAVEPKGEQLWAMKENLAEITADILVDKQTGSTTRAEIRFGPQVLVFDRVRVTGSL